MCWVGFTSDEYRASRDIVAYKIVKYRHGKYYAPFYGKFMYELGKTYHEKVDDEWHSKFYEFSITDGLHCLDRRMSFINLGNILYVCVAHKNKLKDSGELEFISGPGEILCGIRCTIPKGTRYFRNKYGHIVSECIKVEEPFVLPRTTEYIRFDNLCPRL